MRATDDDLLPTNVGRVEGSGRRETPAAAAVLDAPSLLLRRQRPLLLRQSNGGADDIKTAKRGRHSKDIHTHDATFLVISKKPIIIFIALVILDLLLSRR